jgi:hypothetical protein
VKWNSLRIKGIPFGSWTSPHGPDPANPGRVEHSDSAIANEPCRAQT